MSKISCNFWVVKQGSGCLSSTLFFSRQTINVQYFKTIHMKTFSLFAFVFFSALQTFAQTPQRPSGQPGKVALPTPKIQPIKPADLLVTTISFVSIVNNADTKTYTIRVTATIRNNGGLQSAKTQLEAYTRTPSGGTSWKEISTLVNIPAINPGQTFSSTFSFKGSQLTIGAVPFDFKVKADAANLVSESEETNNFSASIVINPAAH